MSGRIAQPRASARRCCSPPESERAGRSRSAEQADPARAPGAARARRSAGQATPRQPEREAQVVPDREAQQERTLEHHRLHAGRGRHAARRPSGRRAPCSRRSSVVLPEPLAPTTAIDVAGARRSRWRRAARAPGRTRPTRRAARPGDRDARRRHRSRAVLQLVAARHERDHDVEQGRPPRAGRSRGRARAAGRPCSSRARSPSSSRA